MSEIQVRLPELHRNQQKIINEAKRFNVLNCGRRFGKSKLSVNLLVEGALEGYPVGYFAPTYKLLEGTFKECYNALEQVIKRKHDQQFIELVTGGIIEFWSLDNPNAGRSRKYKVAIVDEAAFVKDLWEAWTQSIRPTLTDLKGGAWFMSTPKGKNDFYKLWMRGQTGEEGWASWQMPTSTNPFIDISEINSAEKDLPALAFKQEYLAEFNDNVANPFGFQFIKQCTMPQSIEQPVCYGVDLAKSFDWTVIIGLDRFGQVACFERFQKDWNITKQIILQLPKAPIKVDSTGVGDPIVEDLQRQRPNVFGFKYSATSKQQLMEGLQSAIHQRKVGFPEGVITKELESFEYEYTRTGVRFNAPAGMHDDCVNALALAWAQFQERKHDVKYVFI
jgi:hypothetical protein